jgi:hypothetical protein
MQIWPTQMVHCLYSWFVFLSFEYYFFWLQLNHVSWSGFDVDREMDS